jgi:hypothetical protein
MRRKVSDTYLAVWELSHQLSQYSSCANISSTHSYIYAMPKTWVKDYVKLILIDAAESWVLAKNRASGTNREEVVKSVTEVIQAAMNDNNDTIRPDLSQV